MFSTSTAPVVGNGYVLGLTDGVLNRTISQAYGRAEMWYGGATAGSPVGTNSPLTLINDVSLDLKGIGVTTDSSKSGLEVKLSGTILGTVKSLKPECFIIKY